MREVKWKIRHVLKDGTVLAPGEGLPSTEAAGKALRECAVVAVKAFSEMGYRVMY